MKEYKGITLAILIGTIFFLPIDLFAAIDSNNVLDNVLDKYSQTASQWAAIFTTAASRLFWVLVLLSMVWTFGMMALRKADLSEFFAEFIRFTIFTGFFWWLLQNGPQFAGSIILSLKQLAGTANGLGGNFTPSGIVDVGFAIFAKVVDMTSLTSPVNSALGIIIALIILFILALIGINMLLLLIAGWLLAYGGIFFLGFGGSRWTSDMAINYYKAVLGLAAQIMAVVLLVGIGKTIIDTYYQQMNANMTLKDMAVMLIVSLVMLELVNKVPHIIAGIITGSNLHGVVGSHGVGSGLAMAGVAAATMMTGGAALKAGLTSVGGGASAITAAISKASQNVASGTDILSGGGGGSGDSRSGGAKSGSGTPFSEAAGISGAGSSGSSGKPQSSGLGKIGRIGVDAVANLARGTKDLSKNKLNGLKESVKDHFADSIGGKIAATIKNTSPETGENQKAERDSGMSSSRDDSE